MKKTRVYKVCKKNGHGTICEYLPGDSAADIKAKLETYDIAVSAKFERWDTPQFLYDGHYQPINGVRFAGVDFDEQYGGYGYDYLVNRYACEILNFDSSEEDV